MGSDLNPRNISTFYSVSEQPIGGTTGRMVARPVARLIVRPLTIWNSRFQVLNMTIDLVATDLPLAITHDLWHQSYDLCHQSYDRSIRWAYHYNMFRSQVGRNLVVSPVWPDFEHYHDLVATDMPLAITHDLCHHSYDLCHQSYVLSTIGPFFGRR